MNEDRYNILTEYAHLDGCELGDYTIELLCMRDYATDHGMSDIFDAALDAELERLFVMFKTKSEIIETSKEVTETRITKKLLWVDE